MITHQDTSNSSFPKSNAAHITQLRKDNANYRDELNQEGKSSIQSAGNIGSQIAVLQKFGDNYAKRIEKEKKKLTDLNDRIKDVQAKIEM